MLKVTYEDVTIGMDIDPERGSADSGDLSIDLPELFVAVAEAAQERNTAVALLIDEIQYFDREELGALIVGMHRMQQRQLPLGCSERVCPPFPDWPERRSLMLIACSASQRLVRCRSKTRQRLCRTRPGPPGSRSRQRL